LGVRDTEPAPLLASGATQSLSSAQIAKATLFRLAQARLEPTPENYSRAWTECGGASVVDDGAAWARLTEGLVRGLERSGRHWTVARRKDSVRRVLEGSRQPQRLRKPCCSW
jgi:diguanylate cyclase